jgi:hypothetical protein
MRGISDPGTGKEDSGSRRPGMAAGPALLSVKEMFYLKEAWGSREDSTFTELFGDGDTS